MADECAVITYNTTDGIFLKLQNEKGTWCVAGFENVVEGVEYFQKSYRRAFSSQNPGFHAGALLSHISLNPRVHSTTLERLKELIGEDPHMFEISGGGVMGEVGVRLTHPDAKAFHESGIAPNLIDRI